MAAKKKSGPKKASKGKNGCLKLNGRLKKGFKWAKNRKGYCQPVAAKPKKAAAKKAASKKGGKKKSAARKKADKTLGIKTHADLMNYLDVGGKVTKAYEAQKAAGFTAGGGI